MGVRLWLWRTAGCRGQRERCLAILYPLCPFVHRRPLIWRRAGQPDMLVGVVSYGPTPKCGEANLNLGAQEGEAWAWHGMACSGLSNAGAAAGAASC